MHEGKSPSTCLNLRLPPPLTSKYSWFWFSCTISSPRLLIVVPSFLRLIPTSRLLTVVATSFFDKYYFVHSSTSFPMTWYLWYLSPPFSLVLTTICHVMWVPCECHVKCRPSRMSAMSRECHVIWMPCHVNVMSCECHIMWMACHVSAISCECHVLWMPCHVCAASRECRVMCVPWHVRAVLRECQVMSVPCDRNVIWMTCDVSAMWRAMSCGTNVMWMPYHVNTMSCDCHVM